MLDVYGGPVLASHHNCRALVPDQRQLTDDQIKRLVGRGAVIGAAMDDWMLVPGWVRGQTTPQETGVSLATVADHIDHVCQLAGDARHAAIGTDLDGGFGREQSPTDLDTIADLQRLPDLLRGAATTRRQSRAFCTATGCASSGRRGRDSSAAPFQARNCAPNRILPYDLKICSSRTGKTLPVGGRRPFLLSKIVL